MKKTIIYAIILLTTFIFTNEEMKGIDLSKHKWKNRIVLVFANDTSLTIFNKQLEELGKDLLGILDRKIVIYKILPNKFQLEIDVENKWEFSSNLYNDYRQFDSQFEFALIGLDGGIKLTRNQPVSSEELFSIIDQMPMREQELKNKNLNSNKE
jgi:septum formation topological specificity factor MinE